MKVHSTTSQIFTEPFLEGMAMGRLGIYRGTMHLEQTEEDIVGVIRNLTEVAKEGWLTEELLRRDVGIIVGLLSK